MSGKRQTPARQIYRDAGHRIHAACTDCERWVKTFGLRRGWHLCHGRFRQVVSYAADDASQRKMRQRQDDRLKS